MCDFPQSGAAKETYVCDILRKFIRRSESKSSKIVAVLLVYAAHTQSILRRGICVMCYLYENEENIGIIFMPFL